MSSHRPKGLHEVLLQQKRHMSQQLKGKFARFGDEVCGIITQEALKPNGMLYLLQRLGLGSSREFDRQLETLSRFMAEYGVGTFLQRYRGRERQHGVEESGNGLPSQGSLDYDERGRCLGTESMGGSASHYGAAMTSASQSPMAKIAQRMDGPVFDKNGNYIGPERRKTGERRSGRDRRYEIDCIDSNRRYGGDRRNEPRRAKDRQKDPKDIGTSRFTG